MPKLINRSNYGSHPAVMRAALYYKQAREAFNGIFTPGVIVDEFKILFQFPQSNAFGLINNDLWEDARTTSIILPDHEGVFRTIPANEVAWEGARLQWADENHFATFQASATTPSMLANMRAIFNDGSTHTYEINENIVSKQYASGVDFDDNIVLDDIIDVFIGSNTALTDFYCNANQLTGSIPDLSSNTLLSIFYCYSNQLTGSIPDLSSNTLLTSFRINNNQLTGSIPDLSSNTLLINFYCYSNQLTGSIPDLSSNTALVYFLCYSNQLTGSIPDLFSNTLLTNFYCNSNQLTGSIPDLSSNTLLTFFLCYVNQLTGSIPDLSSNTALTRFYCYSNQLTGSIPDLSSNTALTDFRVNNNQLTDYITGIISTSLIQFHVHNNALIESAVNQILIDCDSAVLGAGFDLRLEDGTNAVPTGAGITARTNLIARGATVTTN